MSVLNGEAEYTKLTNLDEWGSVLEQKEGLLSGKSENFIGNLRDFEEYFLNGEDVGVCVVGGFNGTTEYKLIYDGKEYWNGLYKDKVSVRKYCVGRKESFETVEDLLREFYVSVENCVKNSK